ncbi:hypothetical protein GOBAR_DD01579 [Gossypium barbadense]|nr:hypothetical protein GOBAR_DD01579 [Gossypium barbadense]
MSGETASSSGIILEGIDDVEDYVSGCMSIHIAAEMAPVAKKRKTTGLLADVLILSCVVFPCSPVLFPMVILAAVMIGVHSCVKDNLEEFIHRVVTGYLPSAILILFLYAVPPTMMFSAMEGNISRSQRKRSACIKVLYNMGIPYFTLKLES